MDTRSAREWLAETLSALAYRIHPSTAVEKPVDVNGCPETPHQAVDCPGDACRWAWVTTLERVCVGCGCTDSHACAGGCAWATEDPMLCTRCVMGGTRR